MNQPENLAFGGSTMNQSTKRFSNRVDDYVKYRPSYPPAVFSTLQSHCGPGADYKVADIGSGTGIFTALLIEHGYQVYAVEPNKEMRGAAERNLMSSTQFHSITGTAENTGLDSNSVNLITVAQAFHWFRRKETKREFRRILRHDGWTALVWNQRKTGLPFQRAYAELLTRHAPEYRSSNHMNIDESLIRDFLGPNTKCFKFENQQQFDLEGLTGRMRSSSYTPTPDCPEFVPLMSGLKDVFYAHAIDGQVVFDYETRLYLGQLIDVS
jgi:ubiquinone/menaquinone biosynthesis C-methylase UbiE